MGHDQWGSLRFPTGGSKTYIHKKIYKTGGLKMYIPKNFYTKTTYPLLLREKFGGSAAPSRPHYFAPLVMIAGHTEDNHIYMFFQIEFTEIKSDTSKMETQ
ncbi:hypothetical protein Hanom_Chr08g00713591 [Helianthus anomalus]